MRIIDSALEYRKAGLSVIPMSPKDERVLVTLPFFLRVNKWKMKNLPAWEKR